MKQEGVHDVFDFKIHNVIGTDTAENLSRVFGEEFKGFHGKKHLPDDIFGEDAIWAKMRKRGFMTLLGFDACAHKLHRVMGSKPRADHVSETFFCANVKFSKYSSAKKGEQSQRCLGDKMAHWYLLNYTKAFTENYQEANKWIFLHLTAAHEESGQHAVTLDDDLYDFITSMYKQYGETHEIVTMLVADHGMRYGNFMSGTRAI